MVPAADTPLIFRHVRLLATKRGLKCRLAQYCGTSDDLLQGEDVVEEGLSAGGRGPNAGARLLIDEALVDLDVARIGERAEMSSEVSVRQIERRPERREVCAVSLAESAHRGHDAQPDRLVDRVVERHRDLL